MAEPRERQAAVFLAILRLIFCGYRAVHQGIVHDEAFTYLRFVAGPWSSIYSAYDANNHVLYSILAKVSTRLFGLSELSLRLPSLLGGFLLMIAVFWVLEGVTTRTARWLALLAIGLHPMILDFSVAARGYSLALASLVWAIYFAMRGKHWIAGALLGCAVSFHLTMAIPALVMVGLAGLLFHPKAGGAMLLACTAIFFPICWPAVGQATRAYFYDGAATADQSAYSLVFYSLRGNSWPGFLGEEATARFLEWSALPMLAALILFREVRAGKLKEPRLAPLWILAGCIVGLLLAHLALGLKYPEGRTGLFLIVLFGLAWAMAAGREQARGLTVLYGLAAVALLIQFATQMHVNHFVTWYFDKSTKEIALRLKQATQSMGPETARVSATWPHQPALEFYRQYLSITRLQPIERQVPTPLSGYDFYVLNQPDTSNPAAARLRVLFRDELADATLAAEPR